MLSHACNTCDNASMKLREKGRDLTQSCEKTHTSTEQSKKQRDNIKTPPKNLITQLLRTDLGRSVRVTAVTQLVWLDQFMSAQPSHSPQRQCNQLYMARKKYCLKYIQTFTKMDTCYKIIKNKIKHFYNQE